MTRASHGHEPTFQSLERLSTRFGDAFYLLDGERFSANCTRFLDAFRARYPRSRLAYSYKTNYAPVLGRRVQELGGHAEVVSPMEYDLARRLGVPPERIVYNGPGKPAAAIERVLLDGATPNLDSPREVALTAAFGRAHPELRRGVGLRCAFEVEEHAAATRFGLDADGGELAAAFAELRDAGGVHVEGLHCHFCTATKSVAAYGRIARRMLDLAALHFPGAPPAFLNVGGGFFSPMPASLARQFDGPVPGYDDYAEAIAGPVRARYPGSDGPALVLEPGVSVVADVMRFATRVVDVKAVGGRRLAVVAGSVYNVKPSKHAKNLPLTVFRPAAPAAPARDGGALDVVGYTCMEDDRLYSGCGSDLRPGDWVVFDNVGAYTLVLKPPFILPCPPVLELAADGSVEVLKRQETGDDLLATYRF